MSQDRPTSATILLTVEVRYDLHGAHVEDAVAQVVSMIHEAVAAGKLVDPPLTLDSWELGVEIAEWKD